MNQPLGTMRIDARMLAHQVTLDVELVNYQRWYRLMRLGIWLMQLGAWVGGLQIKIADDITRRGSSKPHD